MRFLGEKLLNSFDGGFNVNVIDGQTFIPQTVTVGGYYKACFKSRILASRLRYKAQIIFYSTPLLHYAANVALEGMNALLYTIFVIPDGLLEILTFLGKSYVKHFFNYLR